MSNDHTEPIINKTIQSTEYIYGVKPSYFKGMEFYKAISVRLYLAKKFAIKLYDEQLNGGNYQEIETKLNSVYKAIEFNEQLLKELKNERFTTKIIK